MESLFCKMYDLIDDTFPGLQVSIQPFLILEHMVTESSILPVITFIEVIYGVTLGTCENVKTS